MNYKPKKIITLVCLLVCIAFVSVWGWNKYQEWKIRKNEFCAHEILRNIWNEQWLYGEKSTEFLNFKQLQQVTKNELLQKLTMNIDDGVVKRHGYNFYIYLLSGNDNIYIEKRRPKKENKNFICYAWPIKYGQTGIRAFVLESSGNLFACRNSVQKYSDKKKPSMRACFPKKEIVCNDDETWVTAGTDFWIVHNEQRQWFTCD